MEHMNNQDQYTGVSMPEAKKKGFLERLAGRPLAWYDKLLLLILVLVFLFVFYIALDANKYEATVRAIEEAGTVGVNPTSERLDFGDLSPGTSAVRRVTVENNSFLNMYVIAYDTGDIGGIMDTSDNYFTLKSGDTAELEFEVYMPASATVDATYDGRVYLFKIPTI